MKKRPVSRLASIGLSLIAFLSPAAPSLRAAVPEGGQKKVPAKAPEKDRDDAERPELAAAREKLRKTIERAIGPRESKFYVVAVSQTSYHTSRTRTTAVQVGNQVDRKTEITIAPPGTFMPVESIEFHVQEGRQPCIDFVMERMSPYLAGQLQSPKSKLEGQPPPATGNWKLLGRFKTAEKAQEAVKKAETVYNAEPHWEAPEDKKAG